MMTEFDVLSHESPLHMEYEEQAKLFDVQPNILHMFLEAQAKKIADAVVRNQSQVTFNLPDRVMLNDSPSGLLTPVPAQFREQAVGSVINRLTRTDTRTIVRQRLDELEGSAKPAVATAARLIRYASVTYMVNSMLPAGRTVQYLTLEEEEIPTVPAENHNQPESAITQASDAIAEESDSDEKRGELQVPFVPYARRFYLPQWIALDDKGHLLVNSVNEAEAFIASMQSFLFTLHSAVSLAPYMIADAEYQRKRYGMLGQLINQGRALAMFETMDMIQTIKRRAAAHDLNRGLSLSMPYFDDQDLEMRLCNFEVIPAGRIMFVPAFVVRGARQQMVKVAQDTRLSHSTRKYLLTELVALEKAFLSQE
ncbi:MAG: hypothetical protein LWX83_19120 [Anaerolineae bacterium]|nr:hypothetical protein [Anaerolineae bacterium]